MDQGGEDTVRRCDKVHEVINIINFLCLSIEQKTMLYHVYKLLETQDCSVASGDAWYELWSDFYPSWTGYPQDGVVLIFGL